MLLFIHLLIAGPICQTCSSCVQTQLPLATTTAARTMCRNGARGLILTQPIHAQPPTLPADVAAGGDSTTGGADAAVKHHLGGPVGMPGAHGAFHSQLIFSPACPSCLPRLL